MITQMQRDLYSKKKPSANEEAKKSSKSPFRNKVNVNKVFYEDI